MKKTKSLLVVPVLVLAVLLGNLLAANTASVKKAPVFKADVYIVPKAQDLKIDLIYPAQIKSLNSVKVYSRVLGILKTKNFIEGQKVQKGDILFTIEDDLYQARVDAARANVKAGKASLGKIAKTWNRIKKLYKSKAVSTERRDDVLFDYEKSKAVLALAKAQLKQALIDLNYTKVKAPISGIVGLKSVDLGNLVTSNPPRQLVAITQNEKVYIDFSMPLSDYKNIKDGLWVIPKNGNIPVMISIDDQKAVLKGYVDFISANVDKNTSTVKMRAIVDNKDNKLIPGNFTRVSLGSIVQKNVITIPQKALLQNPLGTIVFVENKGIVGVKPVLIGNESGNRYIVIGGSLQSGDKVIVNNFFRVKPGQPIIIDKIVNKKGK